MVKDSSKKLNIKEAEKVKEVIVKKVIEPIIETPEPTIKEVIKKVIEPVKMPKEIKKPKKITKKLIQTGKENQSNALTDEAEKVVKGNSMGLIFGITIAVAIIAGVSYLAYTKLFKKKSKLKDLPVDQIKSISEVKKIENK